MFENLFFLLYFWKKKNLMQHLKFPLQSKVQGSNFFLNSKKSKLSKGEGN
jgi:hypothetical protein